jgi:hypothetical protein
VTVTAEEEKQGEDRTIPRPMSLRSGVDYRLEEDADRWLAESRRGVTSMSAKTDYLSKEQLALRQSKEVMNHHGVSDASLFIGMYRRAFNPLSGQRPKGRRNSDDG